MLLETLNACQTSRADPIKIILNITLLELICVSLWPSSQSESFHFWFTQQMLNNDWATDIYNKMLRTNFSWICICFKVPYNFLTSDRMCLPRWCSVVNLDLTGTNQSSKYMKLHFRRPIPNDQWQSTEYHLLKAPIERWVFMAF